MDEMFCCSRPCIKLNLAWVFSPPKSDLVFRVEEGFLLSTVHFINMTTPLRTQSLYKK